MTSPLAGGFIAASIACVLGGATLGADYKAVYQNAIREYNFKRWDAAARLLREALKEQPDDTGEPVTLSGMQRAPYLPNFYLGQVLFANGDCRAALAAWQASERGTVRRFRDESRELDRNRSECERRLGAATSSTTEIAPSPSSSVRSPSSVPPPPPVSSSSIAPPPPASSIAPPSGLPSSSSISRSPISPTSSSPSSIPLTPPPVAGPPDVLLTAARFFFRGQYARASATLAAARFDRDADRLQAELFRAASAYAQFLTGGERDQRLRDEAVAHVRACHRLNPAFRPDPSYFSPRFVEFYRVTR